MKGWDCLRNENEIRIPDRNVHRNVTYLSVMLRYWKDPTVVTQTLRVVLTLVTWDTELLLVFIKSNITISVRFYHMFPSKVIEWCPILLDARKVNTLVHQKKPKLKQGAKFPSYKTNWVSYFLFHKTNLIFSTLSIMYLLFVNPFHRTCPGTFDLN